MKTVAIMEARVSKKKNRPALADWAVTLWGGGGMTEVFAIPASWYERAKGGRYTFCGEDGSVVHEFAPGMVAHIRRVMAEPDQAGDE